MAPRLSNGRTNHRQLLINIVFYFLIIVVLPLSSSCQQLDYVELPSYHLTYLLSIEQEETINGLRITATPESRGRYTNSFVYSCNVISLSEPTSWLIPDVSLSPECGPEYFRCREVLVKTLHVLVQNSCESTVVTVFVPLESGMLLLSVWYNINNCTLDLQTEIVSSSDCSPTVVYEAQNKVFTVCISSVKNYIAVYEIHLMPWNGSLIHDIAFVGPPIRESITNLAESYLSNFVLKLSSQEHKVFFAINGSLYVMDVSNPSQTKRYPELPGCDQVHSLSSVPGGPLLLAYCSDRSVYYDTVYGDWTRIQNYSRYGIPYLCPNRNYNVTAFFNDTWRFLQFSLTNSNPMIIDNVTLTSGVCFDVGDTTYFVWSDTQQNTIFVFDFTMQTHYPVASYECLSTDCSHHLLLENQYIVYDVDYTTYALNAETNFSLIFNISRSDESVGVSDILIAVLNIRVSYDNETRGNGSTTTATVDRSTTATVDRSTTATADRSTTATVDGFTTETVDGFTTATVDTTTSPVNNSTTTTFPHSTDSNLTTSTIFTTTDYNNNNKINVIIPTVTVIAGTVLICILVSIIILSVMFQRKQQTRYIIIIQWCNIVNNLCIT